MPDLPETPPAVATKPAHPDASRDEQHMRVLPILYYVFGALAALSTCFGLFYVAIGIWLAVDPDMLTRGEPDAPPPEVMGMVGALVAVIGFCVVVLQLAVAAALVTAGRCLARRRARIFCVVVAAFICLSFPFGTALGVYSLVVLSRPGVVAMMGRKA